jgi:hypothetical protein
VVPRPFPPTWLIGEWETPRSAEHPGQARKTDLIPQSPHETLCSLPFSRGKITFSHRALPSRVVVRIDAVAGKVAILLAMPRAKIFLAQRALRRRTMESREKLLERLRKSPLSFL